MRPDGQKLDLSGFNKSRQFWEAMGYISTGEFALPVGERQKIDILQDDIKTL